MSPKSILFVSVGGREKRDKMGREVFGAGQTAAFRVEEARWYVG